jgi:PadR family transcriptional regulator, regulatory protein PadR
MSLWETQLRKGLVELAVLATIAQGETYGYRIVEQLQKLEGLQFTESTVYPVLTRLARERLLATRAEPSPAGPLRRYYRLTSSGEQRLGQMAESWKSVATSLSGLLDPDQGGRR